MRFRAELSGVTESPLVQVATLAERTPGCIKLCYGESDLPTPPFIVRALHEAALAGHTTYTHTAGTPELRAAIAEQAHRLQGIAIAPDQVMATIGGSMAIYVAIRAFVGAGDNAVILSPAYAIYANAVVMAGAEPRQVPLARDTATRRFALDFDRLARAIDARTRMIVVNSPSNPTGWMITKAEQVALAELAARNDVMVLSDEVYERLAFDVDVAPSMARVMDGPAQRDRLVVVNSFSKTYNMTGWRLGWAQASARTVRLMYAAAEFITSNPTAMVQQAGIAALRDGEASVRALRAHLAARRAQVMAALRAVPGVELAAPDGAFYAFPRIAGLGDSAACASALVSEARIAVAPGSAFGAGGEGHLRLCFASTEATVAEALSRLGGALGHGRPRVPTATPD
ncbi:MAG TPA: aminotransferase class I/II-fold pyridoxal phosphate-dependent enzyme [Gemmatimonadaceae bacterium]|nr:aminotransferase class I/II-fold pyridoxal phosphate-dependent enzyme [Gemmatimonadaceae bacterium]